MEIRRLVRLQRQNLDFGLSAWNSSANEAKAGAADPSLLLNMQENDARYKTKPRRQEPGASDSFKLSYGLHISTCPT